MNGFTVPVPLSLYIHFPWCLKKCPYCDFNSHANHTGAIPESAYVDALTRDLEHELPRLRGRKVNSVFMGGGTPSLISGTSVSRLTGLLAECLELAEDCEITLEANPGAADTARFVSYRQSGVNRLSIGIQSFADAKLKQLGRIHDAKEAARAIHAARNAGFSNINLDIMYGLPEQSVAEALADVAMAVHYHPAHISWYQLTIEPQTHYFRHPPALPDDDILWDMQQQGMNLLQDAGYQQYEISAWMHSQMACTHNLNYWRFGDYLGIGAGAHGKLTDTDTGIISRFARHRAPTRYMDLAGSVLVMEKQEVLDRNDLSLEFMMNALRLTGGVNIHLFQQHTGLPLCTIEDRLILAVERGLIDYTSDAIKPTPLGQRYLNDLLHLFS
jgi:oxygen-independent coproporphyrinogen-3 oxidase